MFLRFHVSLGGLTVHAARLRLEVARVAAADGTRRVRRADYGWDESTLTWDGQPPFGADVLDSHAAVLARDVVELDVTGAGFEPDGAYCFVIESNAGSGVEYGSREGSGLPPELTLLASPPVPTTTTTTSSSVSITAPTTTTTLSPQATPTVVLEAERSIDARGPGRPGRTGVLRVSARPRSYVFLRFRVSGLGSRRPTSALLRLRVRTPLRGSSASGGRVHLVDRCDWNADTLTWKTQPTLHPTPLATTEP